LKYSRSRFRITLASFAALAVALIAGTGALRGELTWWTENIDASSRLQAVFFRTALLPSGPVPVRRPPKETRAELSRLIGGAPNDAELYSLRALESEQQLDFTAAEADWKKYIDVAADKGAARLALADYYHRRHQPREEFDALTLAAREAAPAAESLLPESEQRPWKTYQRLLKLIDEQRLDATLGVAQCDAWEQRYPAQKAAYSQCMGFEQGHRMYAEADQGVAAYQRAFPDDLEYPVAARAETAARRGATADALAIFDASFRPLWPDALVKQYFDLLKRTGSLRTYLEKARAQASANPSDLAAMARLFYYWQQQGNSAAAARVLAEFRQRKESGAGPWTADELLTLARLSESAHADDDAARGYYALYGLARTDNATAETALAGLARLLLASPDQPIHFGSGNLQLYRDVATMDPHPGFLNGVLSLLLNETDPPEREAIEERNAGPYFRRARAAELVALFESRFPNSPQRAELRERVIETYAIYGDNAGVIRSGAKFLTDFPNAPNRTEVALRLADAYARTNQTQQEFAVYDSLLAELARRAQGVPLGALSQAAPVPPPTAAAAPEAKTPPAESKVRSPEYARVLDRYVGRLVSLNQVPGALALYRREIDRNPADPGLYDALAAFLEQNQLGAQIEQTYQRAIAQFQDRSWQQKLARWYLRQRRQADLVRVTRDVTRIFSGTELESYFSEVIGQQPPIGPALYLQLNLAAHQRFPHQLSFVRNLLRAYTTQGTADDSAYEALLRQHWYDADDLRMRLFERLNSRGRLTAELAVARTANPAAAAGRWQEALDQNPATVRLLAEGEAWRGHFEAAAPMLQALETNYPADAAIGRRTAAVYRSLGTIEPALNNDASISAATNLTLADPRDIRALTRLGEIEADRGRFERAKAVWDKIPDVDPGNADGYLEAATIFWDYFAYDDALRWIEEGRRRLGSPALFAFQAGAIRENQRDYERAITEYGRGALAAGSGVAGSGAERRLIALGLRPAYRARVDLLTDNLASGRNPQLTAFNLRVSLLRSQNRRDDLERFLQAVIQRSDAPEILGAAQSRGQVDGFPSIEQAAIERRIAVSTDPVERMSLRLDLARWFEGQGRSNEGAQTIDAVYRDNPAILGVLRATVDYHWRNKNSARAIDVLEQAAGRAQGAYRSQFTLEAARKATESGAYARARGFADQLVAAEPFRAEYVAAAAGIFARQGDDRGLRTFYADRIEALSRAANISAPQRIEQTAEMRRAMIPVLTRLRDFSGALDQYIDILNRYPEDEGLAREAAQYARTNNVVAQLRAYYAKASSDSPKDFRWPAIEARIATALEDFPAAIEAYSRAAAVRPDRTDVLAARLNLEERLLRFDEAAASAEKLYDLSYRNTQWMDRLAQIRARQGRNTDAVAALNKAWIEARPDNAQGYVTGATKLTSWGMPAEARRMLEDGLKRVPAGEESHDGELLYAELLAKTRDTTTALTRMSRLSDALAGEVAKRVGAVAATYYSPDEKTKFAATLANQPRRLAIAEAAGLTDLRVRFLNAGMMAAPASDRAKQYKPQLIEIQNRRLRFGELGQQLEAFERALPANVARDGELEHAAEAYRMAGDTASELRVLQRANARAPLSGALFERYARLVTAQTQRLAATITQEQRAASVSALLNYALEHATPAAAQAAIVARGAKSGPQWTKAYTALAGLYFADGSAPARTAFTDLLGDMTIGARIGVPVDRDRQLAGDLWFYYGGRFGEYLAITRQAGADDYLPATLEAAPGRSEAYFALAESYADQGNAADASELYRSAGALDPSRGDVHDRLAVLAAKAGRNDEAVAEWKLALVAFNDMMNGSRVPPKFWGDLNATLVHIGEAQALPGVRDDIDRLLRLYIRRNGPFQVEPLLTGALAASADPAQGVAWIVDLSRAAADPVQFLNAVVDRDWIPDAQRDILHRRIVESAEARAAQSFGEDRVNADNQAWTARFEWARYLLARKENARARDLLAALSPEARKQRAYELVLLELRVAARTGTLADQLARYKDPLPFDQLRNAAQELRDDGDPASARRVLEVMYQHQLANGSVDAVLFLGLAQIRLEERDTAGALALLRRMTLVSGDAFTNLDSAASLLERAAHAAEAVEFLSALSKAEPWNSDARQRLAAAQSDTAPLGAIAKSNDAPYAVRLAAARSLRRLKGPALSGVDSELDLLSSQTPLTAAQITGPYAYAARVDAANSIMGSAAPALAAKERLLRDAIAIDPQPGDPQGDPRLGPKLALFETLAAARSDALTDAVGRQLLPEYFRDDAEFNAFTGSGFLPQLPMGNRVAAAKALADANQRLGNARGAALFYQIAHALAPSDATARALAAQRAQLDLAVRNAARRPVVSDHLDQDRLVHARLLR
jgi:hypothetical protein